MPNNRIDKIKDRLWSTWETGDIKHSELESIEKELERLHDNSKDPECLFALSELYLYKVNKCRHIASRFAQQGLEVAPCHSGLHDSYNIANNGNAADFNRWNHNRIIEYYYKFINKHSDCFIARRILIENLIDNNRLVDAKREIQSARNTAGLKGYFLDFYLGEVFYREGRRDEAALIWKQTVENNPTNSVCLFMFAEEHAKIGEYGVAKEYYQRSFDLQPRPRKIDALISIMGLHEIQNEQSGMLAIIGDIIEVYKTDYGIVDGPEVKLYLDKLRVLQNQV